MQSYLKLVLPIMLVALFASACSPVKPDVRSYPVDASAQTSSPKILETISPTEEVPSERSPSQGKIESTATEQPGKVLGGAAVGQSSAVASSAEDGKFAQDGIDEIPLIYHVQSGDTLSVVAKRYGVRTSEITSPDPLPSAGLLVPGQVLLMPTSIESLTPSEHLLPDSEIVYGPSATDFNIQTYLNQAGGALSQHQEYLRSTGWTNAGDIIKRVALENSINPRLLVAILEYTCGCLTYQADDRLADGYALGVEDFRRKGLYGQLGWAANQLSVGYYGWRDGTLLKISLPDGSIIHPAPDLNAGSVALTYYFMKLWEAQLSSAQGKLRTREDWELAINLEQGLPALHNGLFGDPWLRAAQVEPLFPADLQQPEMILPFEPEHLWAFASGPHPAWQTEGALAALDFAPATDVTGCVESKAWVVAVADGPVVRSEHGAVVQDLDHDGEAAILSDMHEQTGWAVLYMHIASEGRVAVGTYLRAGDPLGHPSCEGGPATGTHLHIARKYNGEWVLAGGPLAFTMDAWITHAGEQPFQGTLVKGDQVVVADPWSTRKSHITRAVDKE